MTDQEMQCMEVWGGNRDCYCCLDLMGLAVEVYSKPFAGCEDGGDVYYVSSCATGRITRLMVADVSGHGEDAAASAKELRKLMGKYINFVDQSRFVEEMNNQFTTVVKHGRFATAVVMTYFAPTNEMLISNAGHPAPLLYRNKDKTWYFIDKNATGKRVTDIPLGILSGTNYHQCKVYLEPGDMVLCYTDSLIELRKDNNSFEMGTDGLLRTVKGMSPSDLPDAQKLLDLLQEKTGATFSDDVTLLTLAIRKAPRVALKTKLLIPLRMGYTILNSIVCRIPIPQTEWSLRNLGGALFYPLNFLGDKKKSEDKS